MENKDILNKPKQKSRSQSQFLIWTIALILGVVLGYFNIEVLNKIFDVIATIFIRAFQFIAVPTIALAIITTLSSLGTQKNTKKIFTHTVTYTLLTTFVASLVGLVLYLIISPGNIPVEILNSTTDTSSPDSIKSLSYSDHILSLVPTNIIQPFLSGNVLSIILVSVAIGLAISFSPKSENKVTFVRFLNGLQEILYTLIRALILVLPIGIVAFSAQFSSQLIKGSLIGVLGKYTLVIIASNLLQIFVVLPLFLLIKKINPIDVFRKMSSALTVAFFTKSSAGTLPVTLTTAEKNLGINTQVSRFVLPICTTINMNGCATFILVTSLFVMQNSGIEISALTMLSWIFISVFTAIGNAGVPMGCYFLTLSLMSSMGASVGILGLILPIYTVIDMVETVENVWSDSVVCTITNKEVADSLEKNI